MNINTIKNRKRTVINFAAFLAVAVIAAVWANGEKPETKNGGIVAGAMSAGVEIAMVGETGGVTEIKDGNSWPGEIISLRSLAIQPDRDGTLAEWHVRIGEHVRAGQVLGKLSRLPQMPDAIMSLAEKNEELSMSRTNIVALRTYTETRRIVSVTNSPEFRIPNKAKRGLLPFGNRPIE